MEVFGRPPDSTPRSTRWCAGRRSAAAAAETPGLPGSGAAEALRIDLPKGGYVPAFGPPAAVVEAATSAPTVPPRKRLTWVLSAGVGLVFLTGSVAVLRTYVQSPLLAPQALTGNSGTERSPAFSPDGKQIAFVWDGQGGELGLYIQALHSDSARRVGPRARLTRTTRRGRPTATRLRSCAARRAGPTRSSCAGCATGWSERSPRLPSPTTWIGRRTAAASRFRMPSRDRRLPSYFCPRRTAAGSRLPFRHRARRIRFRVSRPMDAAWRFCARWPRTSPRSMYWT